MNSYELEEERRSHSSSQLFYPHPNILPFHASTHIKMPGLIKHSLETIFFKKASVLPFMFWHNLVNYSGFV